MKTEIPVEELRADLAATARDVDRLATIVENLRGFYLERHEENRSQFRVDLFKYEALLLQAQKLHAAIEKALGRGK